MTGGHTSTGRWIPGGTILAGTVLVGALVPLFVGSTVSPGQPGLPPQGLLPAAVWHGLGGSLTVALAALLTSLALGVPVGLGLARSHRPALPTMVACLPLVVPLYLVAVGWNAFLWPRTGILPSDWAGWLRHAVLHTRIGTGLVIGAWAHPMVALAWLAASRQRDRERADAARLLGGAGGRMRQALADHGPAAAAGGAIVFALALVEPMVPSLYRLANPALDVYSADLMQFLTNHMDGRSGIVACAPLAVPTLILWLGVCLGLDRLFPPGAARAPRKERPRRGSALLWLSGATLTLAPPLAALALVAWDGGATAWQTARELAGPAGRSLLVAAAASSLALPPAVVVARRLARPRVHLLERAALTLLLVAPLAVPGSVGALGLIRLANRPGLDWFLDGPFAVALAQALVVLPVVTLLAWAALRSVPREQIEESRLLGAGPLAILLRVQLPEALPGLLVALGVGSLLALTELPATSIILPPGQITLPFQVEQLAHYGTNHDLAAAALLLALGPLLLLPAILMIGPRTSYAGRTGSR